MSGNVGDKADSETYSELNQQTPRARFPSTARLLRPIEYSTALKGKRIAKGKRLVLMASKPVPGDSACYSRLGLIVAKRFAPRAVTRNTIKRVIRDTFRHKQHQLLARDYVFRLHSPIGEVSLRQLRDIIRNETHALLDKAMP